MSSCFRRAMILTAVCALLTVVASPLQAQPVLSELWPNDDGTKWTFDFAGWDLPFPQGPLSESISTADTWDGEATLTLAGTTETAGGTAQNLVGWHTAAVPAKPGLPLAALHRNLWRARPDLHRAIEARASNGPKVNATDWIPLLLHEGFFMELADRIEMWQETWDHSTWTYLTDALGNGQMFTQQLVPELADDVFLHGTVESNSAMVTTPAGTFPNAVKIACEIDYGESDLLDEQMSSIGTYRARTLGWVHYVPDIGPVDMQEEFIPYSEVDCGITPCPQEILDLVGEPFLHTTMQLTAGPVAVETRSWVEIKRLYR